MDSFIVITLSSFSKPHTSCSLPTDTQTISSKTDQNLTILFLNLLQVLQLTKLNYSHLSYYAGGLILSFIEMLFSDMKKSKSSRFICDQFCPTSSFRPAGVWVWGRTRVCPTLLSCRPGFGLSASSSWSSLPFSPSKDQRNKTGS